MGAAALIIAGAGLAAFGEIKQGQIAEAEGRFAKKIAIRNQQALDRQAKAEKAASNIQERRVARQEKIVKASQRAQFGKTGGQIAGSSLAFLVDTASQFSIEKNLVLRTGLIRSRELHERGQIELAKGRWARTLGKQAKKLSYIKAGGSILSGFGAAASTTPSGGLTGQNTLPSSQAGPTQPGLFTSAGGRR